MHRVKVHGQFSQGYTAYYATLLAPMYRTSLGLHFHENKAGRSSYSGILIIQYYIIHRMCWHLQSKCIRCDL